MSSSTELRSILIDLDGLYGSPKLSPMRQNYYAKLALIELCGWVEQSIKALVSEYCSGMRDERELEEIFKRIHGFDYRNIRSLLIQTVGIVTLLEIEYNLKQSGIAYEVLTVQLKALSLKRNTAAHTHISGVQVTYDSPSSIIAELNQIEPAVIALDDELKKFR